MKRIMLFLSAVLLLSLAACTKKNKDPEFVPDTTFKKTGEVTLKASIENCGTKAGMSYSGEGRWERGDQIAVSCTDGSLTVFTLDGTGGTRSAFFKGEIPAGKELGSYAFYPASAIKSLSGSSASAVLPESVSASACSLMAAKIGDTYEIQFVQLLSYVTVKVGNIPSDAVRLVISSDKDLSGNYTFDVEQAMAGGIPARDGSSVIVAPVESGQSSATYSVAVPVAEYSALHVKSVASDGKTITEGELLASSSLLSRSEQRSLEMELPEYYEEIPEIPGAVYVCGTYWAKGNLVHAAGDTAEGFRTGWKIAQEQWYYVNYENATGSNVTFKPENYDLCDHFNFGGLEDPFSNDAASCINAAVGTDVSGKMYLDQSCLTPTTDFDAAKFGDLAWWASNGKWRLPTQAEMQNLLDNASYQAGTYTTPDGKPVSGYLFTDPGRGKERMTSDDPRALTEEEMAQGVFFVKNGRRYDSQASQVNNQGGQGNYWSSAIVTHGKATEGLCYPAVLFVTTKLQYPHENAAMGSRAGFAIKPVYVQ